MKYEELKEAGDIPYYDDPLRRLQNMRKHIP